MQYFLTILFSLSYLLFWGMLCLEYNNSHTSMFINMIYTVLTTHWFTKGSYFNSANKLSYVLLFLGPVIYLITLAIVQGLHYNTIFNPIIWSFVFFIWGIYLPKVDFKWLAVSVFGAYFYAFHLTQYYETWDNGGQDAAHKVSYKAYDVNAKLNLNDFKFINRKELASSETAKKYTLVETWNETCGPCISAMKDLHNDMAAMRDSVDYKYLYIPYSDNIDTSFILHFPLISQSSNIWIDADKSFFHIAGMNSYPYFLLFDKNGQLINCLKGYSSNTKEVFLKEFNELFK